jgi:hypothetical protein
MMTTSFRLLLVLLTLSPSLSIAQEHIQLDQTTVIDNHELPKITYIVPWQAAQLPTREEPPLDALIDHALAPIDRDVLRSQIQFYYETAPKVQGAAKNASKSAE